MWYCEVFYFPAVHVCISCLPNSTVSSLNLTIHLFNKHFLISLINFYWIRVASKVVSVSIVQQSESAIPTHIAPLFWIFFPFRSPQSLKYSPLCQVVDSQLSILHILSMVYGLCRRLSSKESTYQCRGLGFDPWVGKIPQKRKWQPTLACLPGKSHGQRNLGQATVHGLTKSWTRLSG